MRLFLRGKRRMQATALGLVACSRVALLVLPLRWLEILPEGIPGQAVPGRPADADAVKSAVRAVRAASRYFPGATCLVQALAGKLLLRLIGQPSHIEIGVCKPPDGRLRAHAWLISGGEVVLGQEPNLSRYSRVLSPE
jgi:hypothetical protein